MAPVGLFLGGSEEHELLGRPERARVQALAAQHRGQLLGEAVEGDDVTGAGGYTIQIDDSDSFSAPLTVSATVAGSSYVTSTLPTRRMWWRVRANDGGAWSSVRRLELRN